MLSEFKLPAVGIGLFIVLMGLSLGLTVGAAYTFGRPRCYADAAALGLQARWSVWSDCQVRLKDGTWVLIGNYPPK